VFGCLSPLILGSRGDRPLEKSLNLSSAVQRQGRQGVFKLQAGQSWNGLVLRDRFDVGLKEKKLTLPLIYSMNNAPRKEAKRILTLIKRGEESEERSRTVREFVTQYGGLVYAEKIAVEYCARAREAIAPFPDSPAKHSLLEFIEFALKRNA